MRTASRIGSVVLAGTLALTLGAGVCATAPTLAWADSASPAAADTSAAMVVGDFQTFEAMGIQIQVPTSLESESTTYGEETDLFAMGEDGTMVMGSFMSMSLVGQEELIQQTIDETIADIDAEMGIKLAPTETLAYTVNGDAVTSTSFEGTDAEGTPYGAFTSFYRGEDRSAMLISVYPMTDVYVQWQMSLMHFSLTPVQAGAGAETQGEKPADEADPAKTDGATDGAKEPQAATAEGVQTTEIGDWTVSVDPNNFEYGTVGDEYYSLVGTPYAAVPVTLTNNGTESDQPWFDLGVTCYGPDGRDQQSNLSWMMSDTISNIGKVRAGAAATCNVYFEATETGTYILEITGYDNDWNKVTMEVEIDLEAQPMG